MIARPALVAFCILASLPFNGLAQQCRPSIEATAAASVFTLHNDGTATDTRTGLRWSRCALGQHFNGQHCVGETKMFSFSAAKSETRQFKLGKLSNWRLPTVVELSGIVETRCNTPAIDQVVFPDTSSTSYWTITRFVNKRQHHWMVQFRQGENHVDKDEYLAAVRPVLRGTTN